MRLISWKSLAALRLSWEKNAAYIKERLHKSFFSRGQSKLNKSWKNSVLSALIKGKRDLSRIIMKKRFFIYINQEIFIILAFFSRLTPFNDKCSHHTETSNMIGILVIKKLKPVHRMRTARKRNTANCSHNQSFKYKNWSIAT